MPADNAHARLPLGISVRVALLSLLTAAALSATRPAGAIVYRTPVGTLKDNCVVWHDGQYYLFTMYRREQVAADADPMQWRHVWLATSKDGVHWRDVGPVIEDAPFVIYAMRVWKVGDRFVMDHGSFTGSQQNVLRFWESKDLRHWRYLGADHDVRRPDGQRLDHMDVVAVPDGGRTQWFGYAAGGMLRSDDGVRWRWTGDFRFTGDLRPRFVEEPGGCQQIGDRYYLLVGGFYPGSFNYAVATFTATDPGGPFAPDYPAFRLNGSSGRRMVGLWAGFCRTPQETLVSNYIVDPSGLYFWHAPLKRAVVDAAGHLRLGYWMSNDALKGVPVPLDLRGARQAFTTATAATPPGVVAAADRLELRAVPYQPVWWQTPEKPQTAVAMLPDRLDVAAGFVLEGDITVRSAPGGDVIFPAAGLLLETGPKQGLAVKLQTWQQTEIGTLDWTGGLRFDSEDRTGFGCATAAGMPPGKKCHFRLLMRQDLFEMYLDDLLVQTWSTRKATGRIGFLVDDGHATLENLRAWRLNLP